jgi:hypothetical protein
LDDVMSKLRRQNVFETESITLLDAVIEKEEG